jgi:hypothetical protein
VNRRGFLKLAGAVPFIGPLLVQLSSDPTRMEMLRAISIRIANAPRVLFVDILPGASWQWGWSQVQRQLIFRR